MGRKGGSFGASISKRKRTQQNQRCRIDNERNRYCWHCGWHGSLGANEAQKGVANERNWTEKELIHQKCKSNKMKMLCGDGFAIMQRTSFYGGNLRHI